MSGRHTYPMGEMEGVGRRYMLHACYMLRPKSRYMLHATCGQGVNNRAPIGGNAQGRVRVLEDRLANIAARMALVLDGEGGGRSAIKRKSADTF